MKKKMESLLSSFRNEHQKQMKFFKTGSGADKIFNSTWFTFKHMTFLMDKFTPKETKKTEVSKSKHSFIIFFSLIIIRIKRSSVQDSNPIK